MLVHPANVDSNVVTRGLLLNSPVGIAPDSTKHPANVDANVVTKLLDGEEELLNSPVGILVMFLHDANVLSNVVTCE